MSSLMRVDLVLVGVNAGKNIKLNNLFFENGIAEVIGTADNVGHAINYYATYSAFPRGSREFLAAYEAYERHLNGMINGSGSVHKTGESRTTNAVQSDIRSFGGPITPLSSNGSGTDVADTSRNSGVLATGNGRIDSRLPKSNGVDTSANDSGPLTGDPIVVKAILILDPANEDHWTLAGLPKVDIVAQAAGNAGLTRREVDAAIPGWNREQAMTKAMEDAVSADL